MRQALVTTCCPDRDTWSEFYAGTAAAGVLPALAAHLDQCPACQAVLHTLSDATADESDDLVAGLRSAPSDPDAYEGELECRLAVERVRALVPAAAAALPERLGEYRVLGLIGAGGMGAVYRAAHVRLGREVALKVVPPERARAAAAARFAREVAAHGELDHPNVVRATDAGEADGVAFLVMDLVDGIDLDRLVAACGPLPAADACELARQAAAGLQHLAGHGLVHRDVKPSNLMLDRRGAVKVLDFGLAAGAAEAALTDDGQVVGTFDYLAPEQADPGRPVDARTDVYGLGCSLYFLLAGKPPYSGTTPRDKIAAHTAGPVPRVRDARPDVPPALAAVVARMLAKNPAERFATPAAVATALAPFCAGTDLARLLTSGGLEPLARSPDTPPASRPKRRTRVSAVAAVLVLLLIGVGVSAAVKLWPSPAANPVAQTGGVESSDELPPPQPKEPPPPAPPVDAKPVLPVALLGFEERGAGAKDLGAKVADLLFAKLAAKPDFYLVDRTDLKKVLDEQQLSLAGAVKADEAVKVGQLTGARILVTGSVVQVEKKVYLVAKVIGAETGRVAGASVEGALSDDLGALAGKLADAIDAAVTKNADKLVPKPAAAADRVAELNKKLGAGARPVVAVQVSELSARTEVARFARACGFEVIDSDEGSASKADVLITGEGFSEVAGRVGGLVSVRARVELKAVDRKTGKVLAADRQTVVVVDLSEQVAGKSALQEAAAQLAARVLPKLVAPEKKK